MRRNKWWGVCGEEECRGVEMTRKRYVLILTVSFGFAADRFRV